MDSAHSGAEKGITVQYNLTDQQKALLRQIVHQIKAGILKNEFHVAWVKNEQGCDIVDYSGPPLVLSQGVLDVYENQGLMHCDRRHKTATVSNAWQERETGRVCTILQKAFDAVETNFDAADTSCLRYLQPLEDPTKLDREIKDRCLPALASGGTNPKLWDTAITTLGKILEDRLRDIGGIKDPNRIGVDLVNAVFGKAGALAAKFTVSGELEGYRNLYAGAIGAIRNRYGHRLVDPSPETGGAIVVFVDLLLKMLEDLR